MKLILIALLTALACTGITAQLPSYLPAEGLVGWWPFNGNANDESGNGNNGTVNGATLTSDRLGTTNTAYSFSGNNSFIEIPSFNWYSGNGFSLWVNLTSILNDQMFLKHGTAYGGSGDGVYMNLFSSKVFITSPKNAGEGAVTPSNPFTINNWVMITYSVQNNQSTSIYINGILVSSPAYNGIITSLLNPSTNIFLGKDVPSNSQQLLGKIDDIGIWNRALTPEEITALYTGVSDNNDGGSAANATVPAGISYQALARNAQGQPLSDTAVQVKFTLLTDSLTGAAEYSESHSLTTNSFGLFTTAFGSGTPETGTFADINWASGSKYLKVELDAGDGFVDMGTQQLLSVPYSMRSNTSAKAGTIENAGLPVYADNAAALAGGLEAGQMYRTATGNLKIVY